MEIQEIRRARLKQWFLNRSIPPKEKSYISQLIGKGASGPFGERAARRLEKTLGMSDKYLDDAALEIDPESPRQDERVAEVAGDQGRGHKDLQWVFPDEAKLLTLYRGTTDRGRDSILMTAEAICGVAQAADISNQS